LFRQIVQVSPATVITLGPANLTGVPQLTPS
jgi:hypothetical protein